MLEQPSRHVSTAQGSVPCPAPSKTVRQIAEEIVAREGGFVNDPDDPGGATNHGVTLHTMRRLGLDLTGDGTVTVDDVRRLTRAQAVDIFISHYFQRPRIAQLPEALQAIGLRHVCECRGQCGEDPAAAADARWAGGDGRRV